MSIWYERNLELSVDLVESLRVDGELLADVLGADEDGLQVRPRPLHVEPQRYDL